MTGHDLSLDGHGVRLVPLAREHATGLFALVDAALWAGMTSPVPRTVADLEGRWRGWRARSGG